MQWLEPNLCSRILAWQRDASCFVPQIQVVLVGTRPTGTPAVWAVCSALPLVSEFRERLESGNFGHRWRNRRASRSASAVLPTWLHNIERRDCLAKGRGRQPTTSGYVTLREYSSVNGVCSRLLFFDLTPRRDFARKRIREGFLKLCPNASLNGPRLEQAFRKGLRRPSSLARQLHGSLTKSAHTDRFAARWRALGGGQQERKGGLYANQQEHWLGWLSQYDGPGADGRKGTNLSAAFADNYFVNPQMLVYLADAAGIDDALVVDVVEAAFASASTMSSMSSAIRRKIPWKS